MALIKVITIHGRMPESKRKTNAWKATRTSFRRDDANAAGELQRAASGGGAAAERPAWNPELVRDTDRSARAHSHRHTHKP